MKNQYKKITLQKCHHTVMKLLSLKADLTVQQAFDDKSHSVEIKTNIPIAYEMKEVKNFLCCVALVTTIRK